MKMKLSGSLLFVLLAACASTAPPPAPIPLPDRVPRGVIESFCGVLHGEGVMSEVRVLRTTQPIINSESLQALADQTTTGRPRNTAINTTAGSIPVEIPAGSCITNAIDAYNPARDSDVMVMQISAPFGNPFANGQPGVLIRFSLGLDSPTWYWVPLIARNGQWIAARPVTLAAR